MGLITTRLFGWLGRPDGASRTSTPRFKASLPPSQFVASQFPASQLPLGSSARDAATSQHAIRKDLLRMVLRDTLNRNGIPATWMGVEALAATSRGREPGIHARLTVRYWDARLMEHAVALQDNFEKRLFAMDPLAGNWLLGISWQFMLEDKSSCPALPHPGSWTAQPAEALPPAAAAPSATSGPALRTVPLYIGGEAVLPPQRAADQVQGEIRRPGPAGGGT